jgi:hypothetical protein
MPKELTQSTIEQWVALVTGQFTLKEIKDDLRIQTEEGSTHLRVIMNRLVEKGLVARNGGPGSYRRIDNEAELMNWQDADVNNTINLKFPFELEKYVKIYPKSIIIVAGGKNAGKTAFIYNFITMNMYEHQIDLYNSETGDEQMKERFGYLNVPKPAPFLTYARYDHFADVVDPDHVSALDYLDLDSEVYMVGAEINEIFKKIRKVAIIGLQKPPATKVFIKGVERYIERDLAYGGGFTAKRAVLYISMGSNKLKLVYVKTPLNPKVNPNNMTWTYNISEDGTHFENIQRYYGEQNNLNLPYKEE